MTPTPTHSGLTKADLLRLLQATKHNRNYDMERAANILYQYYVRRVSTTDIAASMQVSYARINATRKEAIRKLRVVWPLFADRDVAKLHSNTSLRHAIWPLAK